jgi:hypothetical protein
MDIVAAAHADAGHTILTEVRELVVTLLADLTGRDA